MNDQASSSEPLYTPSTNHPTKNKTSILVSQLPSAVVNNQLEEVLDVVKTLDKTCDHPKCKTKTNLIGNTCNLCKFRYCIKHTLPEVHGCGDLVKKDERQKFLKPVPQKFIQKQEDLDKSRERLKNKLKDMNLSRKAKPPGTNKKK